MKRPRGRPRKVHSSSAVNAIRHGVLSIDPVIPEPSSSGTGTNHFVGRVVLDLWRTNTPDAAATHPDLLVDDRVEVTSTSEPCLIPERRSEPCENVPMGWEALRQWGKDVTRVERLAGGVANDVWSVRINGRLAVGRLGTRSDADLAWETELLQHLDR